MLYPLSCLGTALWSRALQVTAQLESKTRHACTDLKVNKTWLWAISGPCAAEAVSAPSQGAAEPADPSCLQVPQGRLRQRQPGRDGVAAPRCASAPSAAAFVRAATGEREHQAPGSARARLVAARARFPTQRLSGASHHCPLAREPGGWSRRTAEDGDAVRKASALSSGFHCWGFFNWQPSSNPPVSSAPSPCGGCGTQHWDRAGDDSSCPRW